jgi:hypothetical protein
MLAKGIQLTLLIGPVIPIPAPRVVMDALDSVEVRSSKVVEQVKTCANEDEILTSEAGGFKLTFKFSSKSALNTIFIIAGAQNASPVMPALRVMMIVTLNGTPQPLFDGVMTHIEVQPGGYGESGTVSVIGKDLTSVMDTQDWSGVPFPAMPIEARVALLCAKYAHYGLIPVVIPNLFQDVPIPTERIPPQKGTDLVYINELARKIGYVFYIEPGSVPGTNIAYFGPEIKIGVPQPALNVDMDTHTNVENLSFSFDPAKGVLPIVFIQNPMTRAPIPIPIPNLNPLQPPLGVLPTPLSNITMLKGTARMNPMQALSHGLSVAKNSQDSVTGTGSLNVLRYGRPLRAHGLVGVRGAGMAYDGLYYVSSVKSMLKKGEFKQEFELTRNGLVSLTPRIRV